MNFIICIPIILTQGLLGDLGSAISKIKTGPSGGESVASFFIGTPKSELTTEPIYIFPNDKTTLVIVLIPNSGFSFKLFEHYQSFYVLVRALYKCLKHSPLEEQNQVTIPVQITPKESIPVQITPNKERICSFCSARVPIKELFCPHCGSSMVD